MSSWPPAQLAELAGRLAQRGAARAAEMLGTVSSWNKPDATVVTEADHAVQDLLLDDLGRECPDHAIVGEEDTGRPVPGVSVERARYCWLVDPIDGTRAFVRRQVGFTTSLGVIDLTTNRPVAGAVCEPLAGRLFVGFDGGGVRLNGQPVGPATDGLGKDSMVQVPYSHDDVAVPAALLDWHNRVATRNYGSCAIHLAMVAAGMLDASVHLTCRLWDIAGGAALVLAGGGVLTDLRGEPLFPADVGALVAGDIGFFAAQPAIAPTLLDMLKGALGNE